MSSVGTELRLRLESLLRTLRTVLKGEGGLDIPVLVVTGAEGVSGYDFFDAVISGEEFRGKVWAMTTDSSLFGAENCPFVAIANELRKVIDPDSDARRHRMIKANLLRVRGVHKDQSAPGHRYHFRYILDKEAHQDAAKLIWRFAEA